MEPTLICVHKQNEEKRREDEGGGEDGGKTKGATEGKRGAEDGRKRERRYNIGQPLEHNNTERDEY